VAFILRERIPERSRGNGLEREMDEYGKGGSDLMPGGLGGVKVARSSRYHWETMRRAERGEKRDRRTVDCRRSADGEMKVAQKRNAG